MGLINESKKFRMSFLENIIGIVNPSLYNAKAHTRIGTTQGIPDIIITVENKNESILIIVENKLKAEEGYEQTKRGMKHFKSTNDLRVKFIGKTGGKGRVNFIAKISKDDWIGKDEAIFIENNYSIGSETFDIHFEGTFDIFSGSITLPLHYEPRPYIPKNKLIRYSKEEDYEKYLNKREKIKEIIHNEIIKLNDRNIKTYNGSNQIASLNIDIDSNTTVNEFIEAMTYNIDKLSVIVDKSLKEVM